MRTSIRSAVVTFALLLACVAPSFAQAPTVVAGSTPPSNIVVIPISATAAAGSPAVLTIPAPPGGLSNYVCYLAYDLSVGAGATATTHGTSSSTNFNSFAYKVSSAGTANTQSAVNVVIGAASPATGCVKSTVPGTATTFTSPTTAATAFDWYALYFQAP
jgi:hypothetical protein